MNLAVPTEILTMQGEDDAQSVPRKVEASEAEQARIVDLLREAKFTLEANLAGPMLRVRDLLELKEGNVLTFDHPIEQPLDGLLNGKRKFAGQIVSTGKKKAFQIEYPRARRSPPGVATGGNRRRCARPPRPCRAGSRNPDAFAAQCCLTSP